MKSITFIALMLVSAPAFADSIVKCERVLDGKTTAGKVFRGVDVFAELTYTVKDQRVSEKWETQTAWFGLNQDLRNQAADACRDAIANLSCEADKPVTVQKWRGSTTTQKVWMHNRLSGQNIPYSETDSGSLRECWKDLISIGYQAMSSQIAAAERNYKKAHEKQSQAAFDRASEGNANNL